MNNQVKKTSKLQIFGIIILAIACTVLPFILITRFINNLTHKSNCESSYFSKEDAVEFIEEKYNYDDFTFIKEDKDVKITYSISSKPLYSYKFRDNNTGNYFYVFNTIGRNAPFSCTEYEYFETLADVIVEYYAPKYGNNLKYIHYTNITVDINDFNSVDDLISTISGFMKYLMDNGVPIEIASSVNYSIINYDGYRVNVDRFDYKTLDELVEKIKESLATNNN